MTYYRLLRNNKESGPYSEEEMIAKGFKPYDLLWIEGKSAGWRYPSEINAFKPYAPIIEEQPYDRFYKKLSPQRQTAVESNSSRVAAFKTSDTAQPPATPDYLFNLQELPARHIHVTLPSGNTVNLNRLAAKKEDSLPVRYTPDELPVSETGSPGKKAGLIPAENPDAAPVRQDNPARPAAKEIVAVSVSPAPYLPADAIPEAALALSTAFATRSTGFSWTLMLSAVLGIATMVGLGIMIGLSISRERNDAAFNASLRHRQSTMPANPVPVKTESPAMPVAIIPAAIKVSSASQALPDKSKPASHHEKALVQPAVVKNPIPAENEIKDEKKTSPHLPDNTQHTADAEEKPIPVKPASPALNIARNLSVTTNDFRTGAFGGISGLKCILFNSSKWALESVEVEVDYILANNKIYKTEKLLFRDIAAGAQATLDAPSCSRGVKIMIRVIKAHPRDPASVNTAAKSWALMHAIP